MENVNFLGYTVTIIFWKSNSDMTIGISPTTTLWSAQSGVILGHSRQDLTQKMLQKETTERT